MSMDKVIHYIWLGKKNKPRVVKKCIKSWIKKMPGWKIKEWNESNLDLNICPFCKEAYDSKCYAFAADVLRFVVLNKYGGLYLDTDVKLLKSLESLTEKFEAFTGYEYIRVNPGLVLYSSKPHNFFISEMVKLYEKKHFIENGKKNLRVVGEYLNELLEKEGFVNEDRFQTIRGFSIFPSMYFCPTDGYGNKINFSKETYSQHLFAGSWMPLKQRVIVKIKRFFYKFFGKKNIQFVMHLIKKII